MISAAPVLKVRVAGKTTPTDLRVPSGKVSWWLTHLPSKYTLAWVATDTPSMWVVVINQNNKKKAQGKRLHKNLKF
jgi:hypothetical protein